MTRVIKFPPDYKTESCPILLVDIIGFMRTFSGDEQTLRAKFNRYSIAGFKIVVFYWFGSYQDDHFKYTYEEALQDVCNYKALLPIDTFIGIRGSLAEGFEILKYEFNKKGLKISWHASAVVDCFDNTTATIVQQKGVLKVKF